MAGRPSKHAKLEKSLEGRALEMSDIDNALAQEFYPEDEARRTDFLAFLLGLAPGTPNPKSNTRAVHVYFSDDLLRDLYEGWKALIANRQIDQGDSMSRVVRKMVSEYVRLQKLEKANHWEIMREKFKTPEGSLVADPTTAAAVSNNIEAENHNSPTD